MSTDGVTFDENLLYAPADDPDVFPAEVIPNPTSEHLRLSGRYELHVNTANLALVDTTTRKPVYTWPFRYIRRYGAGKDVKFQFEAGRRCPSGEGLFVLNVTPQRGDAVFACIQKRLNVMKERDLHYQSDAAAIGSASSGKPAVPDRQYSHANYQNLPAPAAASGDGGGSKGSTKKPTKKAPEEIATDKKAGSAKLKPAPAAAAAVVVQSKVPPASAARPVADAARGGAPEEAMYAEVDMSCPPQRPKIVGGGPDDQPPLYSAVVKPTPPQARGGGVGAAAGRAPPPSSAVAPLPPQAPSEVNRMIAERRASLRRLDADDTEGYGTVNSVRAAAAPFAAASAAQPPAGEYGCVPPHPTAGQHYFLVEPSSVYDAVDEAYATTESLGRTATGAARS